MIGNRDNLGQLGVTCPSLAHALRALRDLGVARSGAVVSDPDKIFSIPQHKI